MRFALEHQNPLVTGTVTGGSGYPEDRYAFLGVSDPNVLVWALKPVDDGPAAGIVARLWNMAATSSTVTLTLAPGAIRAAQRVTHIETPLGPAALAGGGLRDTPNAYQT
jgi:alpha-mannosidase